MDEWYLKAMRAGCYADFLAPYFAAFPRAGIKVMFFERLRDDVAGFMRELSLFLGIDLVFWEQYEFKKANVTFSGSNKVFHRAAIYFNSRSESFLRQRPKLKRSLVSLYKKLNQASEGYRPMPVRLRGRLDGYYRPCNEALRKLLGEEIPASWHSQARPADSSR